MSAIEIILAVLEYAVLFFAVGYYTGFYRDRAFARLKIAGVGGVRVVDIPMTLVCLVPAAGLSIVSAIVFGIELWPVYVLALVLLGAHLHERSVLLGYRGAGHEVDVKSKTSQKDSE